MASHQPQIRILILAVIFMVGLSVYLMLFVRSGTDSLPVDFGRTNTLVSFWNHVTDAKDEAIHTKSLQSINQLSHYMGLQFDNLTTPLVWLVLPFMLWGLKYLWRCYQIMSVALFLLFIINMVFFFYWIDGVAAFIPSILVAFLLMSLGLGQFGRYLIKMRIPGLARILVPVLLMATGLGFLGNQRFLERDSQSGFLSTEFFWADYSKLPPESVALVSDIWFFFLGLQHIYLARPDVSMMSIYSVGGSPYFAPPLPNKFPMAAFPRLHDGQYLPFKAPGYLNYFLNANHDAGKPVFIQYTDETSVNGFMYYLRPYSNSLWFGQIQQDPAAAFKAYSEIGRAHV
jgi:hypothetical protein